MKVILGNILAIYRKELQSYFASPFAYVIAGVFWLLSGFFFVAILLGPDGVIAQVATRDQLGVTDPPIDVPYQFLSVYLGVIGSFSLFLLPMLSMGLYSEERKRGTLELLATSPVTNWVVAVGKLLGVLTFFATMVIPLMVYETIALTASDPPIQMTVMLLGHAGLILMAAAVLSLGMFLSSLTDSTILAAILTFGLMLFLWIVDVVSNAISGPIGEALAHLSLLKHYTNLVQGVLDTGSVALLLSYVVLGLFLTAQSVEALRYQRS
ncbi:MAG: ABC transporter permease [Oculatellaceae cyanobacterium bins.114]|nr:ABC transporter permease [Oculatellaceae cyanobacterium bins.114]